MLEGLLGQIMRVRVVMPNLNELPPDLVPNLNEAPVLDPAEVIIDPPIIPLPYGPAPNVFLD
jgi:hypothetical protein